MDLKFEEPERYYEQNNLAELEAILEELKKPENRNRWVLLKTYDAYSSTGNTATKLRKKFPAYTIHREGLKIYALLPPENTSNGEATPPPPAPTGTRRRRRAQAS